ncbi:MAG: PIG-L deacetylase family protein, partial [Gammaproteobacteria bacterium]
MIAPHPDDEAVGCAGTIVRHKKCGDAVCVAYITDGRRSGALGLGSEEMASRRRQEAESSAKALRIDRFEWFGLAEGNWSCEQLQLLLAALINQFSPQVIYAPSRVDFHTEHHKVAYGCAQLMSGSEVKASAPWMRVYQVHVPLTPILTNLVADISG